MVAGPRASIVIAPAGGLRLLQRVGAMATKTVAGLFDTGEQAERAAQSLESANIPGLEISIVADRGAVERAADAEEEAEIGAGVVSGLVLGGTAGFIASLPFLAVPGAG